MLSEIFCLAKEFNKQNLPFIVFLEIHITQFIKLFRLLNLIEFLSIEIYCYAFR